MGEESGCWFKNVLCAPELNYHYKGNYPKPFPAGLTGSSCPPHDQTWCTAGSAGKSTQGMGALLSALPLHTFAFLTLAPLLRDLFLRGLPWDLPRVPPGKLTYWAEKGEEWREGREALKTLFSTPSHFSVTSTPVPHTLLWLEPRYRELQQPFLFRAL